MLTSFEVLLSTASFKGNFYLFDVLVYFFVESAVTAAVIGAKDASERAQY